MKLLILDNYDSFTYNLVHYCEQFVEEISVYRNDEISLKEVANFDAVLISPGPGLPVDAGITKDLIRNYAGSKKIFGVCLGFQAIAEVFDSKLHNLNKVIHGMPLNTIVIDKNEILFNDMPSEFISGRYHSWVVDKESLGNELKITAIDNDGNIMALSHKSLNVKGVQFHPESVMTENGIKIIENWLKY